MCTHSQVPGATGASIQPNPLETIGRKEVPGLLGLNNTVVTVEYSLPPIISCKMVFSKVSTPFFFDKSSRPNEPGDGRYGDHLDTLNKANIVTEIRRVVHFVLEQLDNNIGNEYGSWKGSTYDTGDLVLHKLRRLVFIVIFHQEVVSEDPFLYGEHQVGTVYQTVVPNCRTPQLQSIRKIGIL